ncbi:hypothetical protein JTB14_011989 [Gonioctena quinquepunctata]|nr:hypothetical protein JTB14_011989 [Gonioctena quinquepunctata]
MVTETSVSEKNKLDDKGNQPVVKASIQRWAILILYISYAALSTLQWVQYSIITDVIMKYYHVSSTAVDWTSMSFMLTWPFMFLPASFIIDKLGLRVAGLIGAFATAIGAGVKVLSIGEDLFYVVLLGQIIVAISQTFILNLPSKLTVTWFKPEEISTVCSLGIFGMTLGTAIGFVVPPIMVKDSDNLEDIGADLKVLCWTVFLVSAPVALMVFFYFPKEPPNPPSQAMLQERSNRQEVTLSVFMGSIRALMTNKAFLIHVLCYGCNLGIYSAIGTLLNQFVLNYFPGAQEDAGRMGLVMIVAGMLGSVLTGVVLDKTHRFKETSVVIFVLSAIGMGGVLYALEMRIKWLSYLAITVFGFFLNAYLPAGVEFATEISYPSPESTVMGLLFATSQVIGLILTIAFGEVTSKYGTLYSLIGMIGILSLGAILTIVTPNKLNRQAAFNKGNNTQFSPVPQKEKNEYA